MPVLPTGSLAEVPGRVVPLAQTVRKPPVVDPVPVTFRTAPVAPAGTPAPAVATARSEPPSGTPALRVSSSRVGATGVKSDWPVGL